MSAAEAAAARAKDPDYILPTRTSEREQNQSKSPKLSSPISSPFQESAGSTQDTGRGEKNLTSTSLPPEILGLYQNRQEQRKDSSQSGSQGLPSGKIKETPSQSSQPNGVAHSIVEVTGINEPIWGPAKLDSCPVIMVPKNFQPKEGSKLTDNLYVGKHLSSGLQGGVYDLVDGKGKKANMVMKLVHNHAPLAEVEREWEVGIRLNQLAEMDGSLPGFMGVGAGIRGGGKFRGMLLERLNGTNVDKIICTRDFHDVQYVYNMLFSVFSALDRAQGALGFHHSDLRLANVMEIHSPEDSSQGSQDGHSVVQSPDEARLSGDADTLTHDPQDADAIADKLRHQFKIIDYGLAIFDENFAAGPDVVFEDEKNPGASRRSLERQASISPPAGCTPIFNFNLLQKDHLNKLPQTSPIEKLYRFMWRRKGDVYHLVFELGEWLDGRVWSRSDELDVLRLMDFIEHVIGVRMKAWFVDDATGEDSMVGWRARACGPFERHDQAMHFLRRWSVRLRGWVRPSNPGLTAAEALTAPFFTKRVSLRGVIHGCSTRYSTWTKTPKAIKSGKVSV